ncbi:MAG: HAMP domain-containing sensor histidine kinase [Mesobacillus sp.]|uniref:two-component system sensor histidine kinase NtrB n=1 Tax=Mesobacillus sp. TaxID=2675271 RepID=UPI003C3149CD
MQNSYRSLWLTENIKHEIKSAKHEMLIHPPVSINNKSAPKKSVPSSKPSKSFTYSGSLYFQQTHLDLADLKEKKACLKQECDRLDKEILSKQQMLQQLNSKFEAVKNDYQAASASKLAAGLAHEIRNPLTTIKGFIQLLKPEFQNLGKSEFADVALEEINRANGLLSEFLSIFKPGSSERNKISLISISKTIGSLFASEALLKEIELTVKVPDDDVFVWADEKQLKQVALNLLKNAFEAIEESDVNQGEITIAVNMFDGYAKFSVIDNGAGLSETEAAKIFTPFYTTKENGTGIGLVICKQIIEEHGGRLKAKSKFGRTRFSFELPAI